MSSNLINRDVKTISEANVKCARTRFNSIALNNNSEKNILVVSVFCLPERTTTTIGIKPQAMK